MSEAAMTTSFVSRKRRALLVQLAGCTAMVLAGLAHAESNAYPHKPITIVVGYPAGGDTDVIARVIGEKLATRLGQPVVVDNRTGANGTIASNMVSKAARDGYTLLLAPNTVAITPHVLLASKSAQLNPSSDLTPIIQLASQSLFVAVGTDTGISNMKELVSAVKGGKINSYASPGYGSPMHVLAELVDKSAGIKLMQIPYRGSVPAVADMVAGQVPMMYTSLGPVLPFIETGKLKILAVADPRRSAFQPQIPTLQEAGFPNADVGAWQALMGPKNMPAAIVKLLNENVNEILKMPDVVARMKTITLQPEGGTPEKMRQLAQDDYARYGKLVKEFNIKAE